MVPGLARLELPHRHLISPCRGYARINIGNQKSIGKDAQMKGSFVTFNAAGAWMRTQTEARPGSYGYYGNSQCAIFMMEWYHHGNRVSRISTIAI
eukprot:671174-Pyramimonas_sp.AAC.1